RNPDGNSSHRKILVLRAFRPQTRYRRLWEGADERSQSPVRDLGARRAHRPSDVSTRLHAFDILVEHTRHSHSARGDAPRLRDRLRSEGHEKGSVLSLPPSRTQGSLENDW